MGGERGERERSALFAWSVLARVGRCGCLVSWIHSEKRTEIWLLVIYFVSSVLGYISVKSRAVF